MLGSPVRWLVCLLLSAGRGWAQVEDGAEDFSKVSSDTNIQLTGSEDDQGFLKRFRDDDSRYVRQNPGPGILNYTLGFDISEVRIDFYTREESLSRSSWLLRLFLGVAGEETWANVGEVASTKDVGSTVESQSDSQTSAGSQVEGSISGSGVSWSITTNAISGWLSGSIILEALDANTVGEVDGCSERFSLQILGQGKGIQDDFQVGKITIQPVGGDSRERCSVEAPDCPEPADSAECPSDTSVSQNQQTFWYDGATSTDSLYQSTNIRVVDDLPDGLDSGTNAFARSDSSSQGVMTYRFDQGGMVLMAVTILVTPAREPESGYVSVTPRVDLGCNSAETNPRPLTDYNNTGRLGSWVIYDLEFALGPLPPLGCDLPEYAVVNFDIEPDFDIRIASVRIAGAGRPAGNQLTEVDSISDTPEEDGGILSNMLFVYIAAGVGGLIVLFLLVLVWYCLGRPCCCTGSRQGQQAGNIMDGKGGTLPPGHQLRGGSNGHVIIAVDSVYPADMPPSYDDDGRFSPEKYSAQNPAHKQSRDIGAYSARGVAGGHNGSAHHGGEPVVDLSVPGGGYQPVRTDGEGIFALSAPRHGQDIFDTWQHTGMGYASGDEQGDMSGPLDTQAPSFTANPPISSTGNTSPSQESSVLGVTAQLGMRLNELRGMQSDHERLARGERARSRDGTMSDPETTQSAPTAPEPLGVAYGKKIGVGGFGAVYEGTWNAKQVAVKVIKMPQTSKPVEEKAKMGFMEYAISGILLHDNIVQTYQADIRPIFLNDDGTSEGQKSKSGWTGLGDFLSNDEVSAQLQRSMRIQEWELRLIMEYCNRGNLKEAIRNGTLQRDGAACALDVALLGLDVAKGCQAIHRYNIIHGDLKPHNVLLTVAPGDERGWIGKIADFGLSVKIKRGEQHVSGIQHGTEGYVAPEVLQTRRMVKASDVYSFGILMWELWHARLYYEEHRNAVKRMRRPNLEFRPTFERHCPEEWVNLAKLCWSLRPEERPDFDRVVKMMAMVVDSLREKVNSRGIIPRPDPAHLNLL